MSAYSNLINQIFFTWLEVILIIFLLKKNKEQNLNCNLGKYGLD